MTKEDFLRKLAYVRDIIGSNYYEGKLALDDLYEECAKEEDDDD